MKKELWVFLGLGALVVYYVYTRSKMQSLASATTAASNATTNQTPSTFVTARNNFENNLVTNTMNGLSTLGF